MRELLTSAQMRAIEGDAIRSGAVTGLELMERAGRAVVEAVFSRWPELAARPGRAVVICGPGNNGGDGFVVARLLHDWGWQVTPFLLGDAARLPPDARINHDRWAGRGGVGAIADTPRRAEAADLIVDALFGTGLARPLGGAARDLAVALAADAGGAARTVAVDIPSGLCSDSGRVLGNDAVAIGAALTVSFHRPKLGHFLAQGPAVCGGLAVADIGLDAACPDAVTLTAAPSAAELSKAGSAHKYGHGHALVLAGGAGRGGAGRLAARAALRVGAGLVTLGCPAAAMQENAAQLNAIMQARIGDAAELDERLQDGRINALCLGPGLGVGAGTRALVGAALASGRNTVLDADALTSFAASPTDLFAQLHDRCILTPHDGEFARLFPDLAAPLRGFSEAGPARSRVDVVRQAAARAGCVVLLKGPDTVIARPDGRCAINSAHYDRAAPWLATAGAGDVLAGLVCGLMARGLAPMRAAEAGAWLHVAAAMRFGPGLISEDLPEALPGVFRDLDVQGAG